MKIRTEKKWILMCTHPFHSQYNGWCSMESFGFGKWIWNEILVCHSMMRFIMHRSERLGDLYFRNGENGGICQQMRFFKTGISTELHIHIYIINSVWHSVGGIKHNIALEHLCKTVTFLSAAWTKVYQIAIKVHCTIKKREQAS